ncbi:MAG TPA: hypothetical protein PK863_03110 [Candidatus Dojkabacteria bacterium]|nr:hypothetical protein [Candidatus Dojkabacteria bacterium]HRP51383.1 hypothetical protein [Candidatus Dojkabacteria bacterium]
MIKLLIVNYDYQVKTLKEIKFSTVSRVFFLASFLTVLFHFLLHPLKVLNMSTSMFYMDEELTLASILTVSFAFYCGILALEYFLKSKKLHDFLWILIFWGLAIDEYFSIHEYLNDLFKKNFSGNNLLNELASLSWVFTLGIIFLLISLFIIREVIKERDKSVKLLQLLGIITYITVIGVEVIGGQTYGSTIYVLFVGIEEGLEMIGTVFFIEAFRNKLLTNKNGRIKD